ncbi:MAG: hypothetical protein ACLT38_05245 [Akkermansia sp.]
MEIIKNNKVIVRKEDASKKVFKGVSLDSLSLSVNGSKDVLVKGNFALPTNIRMNNAGTSFQANTA